MKNTIVLFSFDLSNLPTGFSGSRNKSVTRVPLQQKCFFRGKVPHNPGRAVESFQKRNENRGRFS